MAFSDGFKGFKGVVAASPQVMAACGGGLCRKVVFASLKEKKRFKVRTYPQGSAQLHSGRANKRKAILNFLFPLEGNASKRQRVYEVKNDDAAPLLSYAGPTLPDLAILCRIAT